MSAMREELYLFVRAINRQTFNPTTVKHRDFDCHIATAKQCGTHWIKYLLSLIISELYDVPQPLHIGDDSVVGHTKNPTVYHDVPKLAVTHSHPHYLLRTSFIVNKLALPKYVVLVRDPRDLLVSAYEKYKGDYLNKKMGRSYDVSFSEYLRGDVTGKTRIEDIWGLMLFFNSWGSVIKNNPNQCKMIKYEQMLEDVHAVLRFICDFIPIEGVTDHIIDFAVNESTRQKMKENINPVEAQAERSVNISRKDFHKWYCPEDKEFVNTVFKRYLRYDFGYNLADW